MKAKIGSTGNLYIVRKNEYRSQNCIHGKMSKLTYCSDVCPAFKEPEKIGENEILLRLCHECGVLTLTELVDERPN